MISFAAITMRSLSKSNKGIDLALMWSALTCKMRRAQAFICSVVGICGAVAQTDPFVFTGVIQTSVKLFTKPPGVVVVAPAVVRAFPETRLTDAVPGTKPKQRRPLAELRFDGHVEPQTEPAQLRVVSVQRDEVMVTRGEPLGLNVLAFVYVVGEKKLAF